MSKFIYGLNTSNRLGDLEDLSESLKNLGLNIEDVNIIRDTNITVNSGGITRDDLKSLSNLDLDVKKEFIRYRSSTQDYVSFIDNFPSLRMSQPYNLKLNSRLGASSIKYNYVDFENAEIKTADISTSRVSSWSTFDDPVTNTSPILYNGDLEVIGPDSPVRVTELSFLNDPIPTKYESEVPTHLINLEIDGTNHKFYVMKGIPVEFDAFFKNASFLIEVSKGENDPRPSWEIENTFEDVLYDNYENISSDQELLFFDSRAKSRKLRFYYNPAKILRIDMNNMNIQEFPTSKMDILTRIDFRNNNLLEIPDLSNISPSLTYLDLSGNNLTRTDNSAQSQLDRLPDTIEELYLNGCFNDDIPLDLTSYINLRVFSLSARDNRRNVRRMSYDGETPAVNSSSIINYNVYDQQFSELSYTVAVADNLEVLNIRFNNIIKLDESINPDTFEIDEENGDTEIKIKSDSLNTFNSRSNSHNIVNLSGKADLRTYNHTYSRALNGNTSINGFVSGCNSLEAIRLTNTDATGQISTNFSNLPSLEILDLRGTKISGTINNNSFSGSTKLRTILISAGRYDTTDFIQQDSLRELENLRTLYIYNNINIGGTLPDFSNNTNLRNILIQNTSLSGNIPSFNNNENLFLLRIRYSNFTGYMPEITSGSLRTIDFTSNNLTSDNENPFPILNTPNLRVLRVSNNNFNSQISSFELCTSLRILNLSNNNFESYVSGALINNLNIRSVDLSNNNISLGSVKDIINDLYENWELNNRGNVFVNLRGNNYNETDLISDENINNKIEVLRLQGWIVLI